MFYYQIIALYITYSVSTIRLSTAVLAQSHKITLYVRTASCQRLISHHYHYGEGDSGKVWITHSGRYGSVVRVGISDKWHRSAWFCTRPQNNIGTEFYRHNPHFKYKYDHYCIVKFAFSALTLLVGGGRKGIWPVKKILSVVCWWRWTSCKWSAHVSQFQFRVIEWLDTGLPRLSWKLAAKG